MKMHFSLIARWPVDLSVGLFVQFRTWEQITYQGLDICCCCNQEQTNCCLGLANNRLLYCMPNQTRKRKDVFTHI